MDDIKQGQTYHAMKIAALNREGFVSTYTCRICLRAEHLMMMTLLTTVCISTSLQLRAPRTLVLMRVGMCHFTTLTGTRLPMFTLPVVLV